MPRALWKGHITFGLVSIPIHLVTAARPTHVRFHEIHRSCGTRIHHQLYCPYDERVVTRDEVALGFETDKDKYVLVEPQELKKIQPKSSREMEIQQFVKLAEVDPLYMETSYFAVPEEGGKKAYALLLKTLEDMSYAAQANMTLHNRERSVVIRAFRGCLTIHTLFTPKEIQDPAKLERVGVQGLKKQETALGEQFAKSLLGHFEPKELHDEYQERVEQLMDSKMNGRSAPKGEPAKRTAPVIDLMSALKKSLAKNSTTSTSKPSNGKKLKRTA
jgi:DNA end-binding protein Ku